MQSVVMTHHNPIYTLYSNGTIFNTKRNRWLKIVIHTNNKTGYRSVMFSYSDRNGKNKLERLSRALLLYFISEAEYFENTKSADHINRDPLDNRIENLRWATKLQQVLNQNLTKSNTSGFKGVSKDGKGWKAQIGYNKKVLHLGQYTSMFDAVVVYRKKHIELFGTDSEYYPDNYRIKQSEILKH